MSTENSKRISKVKTLKKELGLIAGISLGLVFNFERPFLLVDQSNIGIEDP